VNIFVLNNDLVGKDVTLIQVAIQSLGLPSEALNVTRRHFSLRSPVVALATREHIEKRKGAGLLAIHFRARRTAHQSNDVGVIVIYI
jgi:hypothetical protein